MAFKSRSDLVGKRFLCIYANHCSDHHSDTNNNTSKTANSNPSQSAAQSLATKQDKQRPSKDCTEKCFNTVHKLKTTKIQDWPWRSGIIRASSHRDALHPDLSVSGLAIAYKFF